MVKYDNEVCLKPSEFKQAIIESRDSQCDLCGRSFGLTIHHKNKNPFDFDFSNLQVICRECHDLIHYGKVFQSNIDFELQRNKLKVPV